ncbi:cyun144 [Cyclophragma undans nucleopolyhedrovirus]|uniref:Cyun144 n=1 Tax=Cyclophragma undans nucleopolyhedrovirus TaxID=1906244 RepID=A0A288QZQ7_9ABAC|nr:cyun144 [Cyclophragma undans nucleopolyhedrovirus]AOT85602.1 cyun144 [Cyclophragma undans nucleopolyhedrovirus]
MNRINLIKYALRITAEYKENVTPHFDNLRRLRELIEDKITNFDLQRFNCSRDELVGACMQININSYLPTATIDMRLEPNYVYYRICQNCHTAANVASPDDHSIQRYLCAICGTCLVIDHPIHALTDFHEAVDELMEIQRINAGGAIF